MATPGFVWGRQQYSIFFPLVNSVSTDLETRSMKDWEALPKTFSVVST